MSESADQFLDRSHASTDRQRFVVPGRIEVLGKHTDYAGGRSLLCATEQGASVAVAPWSEPGLRITDARTGETAVVPFDPDLEIDRSCWHRYPMTVVRRLCRDLPGTLRGAEMAFSSDLPRAAGISSSSVLTIAVFHALAEIASLRDRPEFRRRVRTDSDLATYLGCIENGRAFSWQDENRQGGNRQGGTWPADGGVGTAGGSEDHTAILFGQKDTLVRYAFCPVRFEESAPLPENYVFAVASSGIKASKAGTSKRSSVREHYNRLSHLTDELAAIWRTETGAKEATLGDIVWQPGAAKRLASLIDRSNRPAEDRRALATRLEQFVFESEHAVPEAAAALRADDLEDFRRIVEQSVETGARCLGNQIPETLYLTEQALRLGALAASPFGAGFGGSVWALVRQADADEFSNAWRGRYAETFPEPAVAASFFATRAGAGLLSQ